jgi:hypothetical protein
MSQRPATGRQRLCHATRKPGAVGACWRALLASAWVVACAQGVAAQALPPVPMVPGGTWTTGLREGEIKRVYDGGLDRTEVWLQLVPHAEGGHPNPTTLYFAALYRGRRLTVMPDRVWVRAQSNLTQEPRRLRSATLALSADGQMLINLVNPTENDEAARQYPCGPGGDCGLDGILAPMATMDFLRLLHAKRVFGEALGFPFTLAPEQLKLLAEYARELVPRER